MKPQERIAACIAEVERRLAVCNEATVGPWGFDGKAVLAEDYDEIAILWGGHLLTNVNVRSASDGPFIADSRNQRPAELEGDLELLKWLKEVIDEHPNMAVLNIDRILELGETGSGLHGDARLYNAALRTLAIIERKLRIAQEVR